MSIRSFARRGAASSFLIIALSLVSFADTIRLKDGSIIKGKIISFGGGSFVIAMGEGTRRRQLTFGASEVESIQFDTTAAAPQNSDAVNRTAAYQPPVQKTVTYQPQPQPQQQQQPVLKNQPATVTRNAEMPTMTRPTASSERMKPVEWQVKVLADNTSNGWTNTGWVVKKGQRIRIEGDGTVSLGKGQMSSPSGIATLDDNAKLLKNVATGALIAVIGDDNNEFIYIGSEREFTATRDGTLFLGINEGRLEDNSGSFNVKVAILPDKGE